MKNKPLILGHRGYRKKFPENTLLAFSKAFEFGADGIECDVQKTSDGVYVIFHDENLERMTKCKEDIGKITFAKLQKLKAGSEKIPDLDSFLDSLPLDKTINIELKEETLTVEDCAPIHEKLTKRGMKKNIHISSFMHELLPFFKKRGYETGMLFDDEHIPHGVMREIIKIPQYRPFSINLPVDMFKFFPGISRNIFIFILSLLPMKKIFWTVNTKEQYEIVKNCAHCVITDNIEDMIKLRDNN